MSLNGKQIQIPGGAKKPVSKTTVARKEVTLPPALTGMPEMPDIKNMPGYFELSDEMPISISNRITHVRNLKERNFLRMNNEKISKDRHLSMLNYHHQRYKIKQDLYNFRLQVHKVKHHAITEEDVDLNEGVSGWPWFYRSLQEEDGDTANQLNARKKHRGLKGRVKKDFVNQTLSSIHMDLHREPHLRVQGPMTRVRAEDAGLPEEEDRLPEVGSHSMDAQMGKFERVGHGALYHATSLPVLNNLKTSSQSVDRAHSLMRSRRKTVQFAPDTIDITRESRDALLPTRKGKVKKATSLPDLSSTEMPVVMDQYVVKATNFVRLPNIHEQSSPRYDSCQSQNVSPRIEKYDEDDSVFEENPKIIDSNHVTASNMDEHLKLVGPKKTLAKMKWQNAVSKFDSEAKPIKTFADLVLAVKLKMKKYDSQDERGNPSGSNHMQPTWSNGSQTDYHHLNAAAGRPLKGGGPSNTQARMQRRSSTQQLKSMLKQMSENRTTVQQLELENTRRELNEAPS